VQVSADQLLKMYQTLQSRFKELEQLNSELCEENNNLKKKVDCLDINQITQIVKDKQNIIDQVNQLNVELSNQNKILNDKLVESSQKYFFEKNDGSKMTRKGTTVGDESDYEYTSDGKRMCFINYITGHVTYNGEHLFSILKKKMINFE
jgi:hypothetical protein